MCIRDRNNNARLWSELPLSEDVRQRIYPVSYTHLDVYKRQQNISAFPIGEENVGFKQYFTGESWLARLTNNKDLNVPMSCLLYTSRCV